MSHDTQPDTHIHTQPYSPGCLCNPCTSCVLCLPVFHDQFILPACSFPSSPTTPSLLLSVLPPPIVTLSVYPCLLLLLLFFSLHSAHLTPYFSLIWRPLLPANPFTPSLPFDYPSPHYLSGCSPLLPLAPSPNPFYTFFSCHPSPVGFFTLLFHLSFYSIPHVCVSNSYLLSLFKTP